MSTVTIPTLELVVPPQKCAHARSHPRCCSRGQTLDTRKQQRCEVAENRSVYPRALCQKTIQKLKMVASRRKHKDHRLIEVPLV